MDKGLTDKLIEELKPQFNCFRTTQDRKYVLYQFLRYRSNPYKIEKLFGSNQILVYDHDNKLIYDSDNETQEQKTGFEAWFRKIMITWLIINLP